MVHKSSGLAASTGGGTGGGTISNITSTGGTLTVTSPTGPTTNVDVANNTANTLAGYNNSGVFSDVAIGANLSLSGGTLTATAGGGAVSSVFGRTGAISANYGDYAFNLVSGVSTVSQGGTGLQTLSAHGVLLGEGISNIGAATTGISGRLLIDQGSSDPNFQIISGDAVIAATGAITLATVNVNVGSFGSSTSIPNFTVNSKGLLTAAGGNAVVAPAGTLTGSVLASNVTASSLTTVGALASGSLVSGFTIVSPSLGGTGVNNSSATGVAQWSNGVHNVSTGLFNGTTAITQAAGDNSTKVATDAFVTTAVNNAIAGVNPAVAVQFATTQASDTSAYTYNNGASGIGATLTGSNNVAFTADGQTATALLQRVLIKNDTQSPSGAFNGIYYVSQLQTAILPPILTRALDYDQPSDINNTGAIPVINGTLNASTSWVETATVNTVGTDPLAFTKFTLNPTTIITTSTSAGGSLSGTYPNPTIAVGAISGGTSISISNSGSVTGITYTGSASGVSTITNSDGSLTISPQTGTVIASINLGHINSYTTQYNSVEFNIGSVSAGSTTVNWNNGNVQYLTATGAVTLAFSNSLAGGRYMLHFAGAFSPTWPGNVRWSNGTIPSPSASSGHKDIYTFVYSGVESLYDGQFNPNFAIT